ncbi:rRNA N6-adenosine-methyltransferase ZCCHC4 [Stomoxys calcitrans]|uniref:rRNA N6-adenosine-methyltransferase ZCCHC4 n=1 Tax=Stomoxys calcitrans TaxID=35570 RepID=UPI0027E25C4A|nr:rRNA N6-adenosine-methyltransferase ZCCHC4 [Stomoxys calcitrans]
MSLKKMNLPVEKADCKKLSVKCEEEEEGDIHPRCVHGPTVLFYYEDKGHQHGYYACSAHRDKKQCSFHVAVEDLTMKHLQRKYNDAAIIYRSTRQKFQDISPEENKHFCLSCNVPLISNDLDSHVGHDVKHNLSKRLLKNPTIFLPPLDNDKVQAQYFFDEKSLEFFENTLRDLKISKVICMGAPRLHAHLSNLWPNTIKSFLLDFDHRFYYFYNDQQFCWYNMCNNHFFDELQRQEFFKFLKCKSNERSLIFTDPPFGCRTELIGNTLQKLTRLYNKLNELPYQPLPIFWIFPYFSGHYLQQVLPSLQMCDYKINYTNHDSYTDVGKSARKQGSPVRLFTNVPLDLIKLPIQELYKYCSKCERYTALENRHCDKCKSCPSKNGSTYVHCNQCGLCVKPNYVHCQNCRRCTQSEGHNCIEYQSKQRCFICRRLGHIEPRCDLWQNKAICRIFPSHMVEYGRDKRSVITCLLCNGKGHNELHCEKRSLYLKESTFMGETQLCEYAKYKKCI